MIYKFSILSDEVDNFKRVVRIDAEQSFHDLHRYILEVLGYNSGLFTSFFVCDDDWSKQTEITLMEMDTRSDMDNYIMDDTQLEELLDDEGQKLLFQFDMLNDRNLFLILSGIECGNLEHPELIEKVGNPPAEAQEDLFIRQATDFSFTSEEMSEEFFGADLYNEDEITSEGFSDDIEDLIGNSSL